MPDMIDMNELNHATLLHNVNTRYCQENQYTFVGPTIVILNPFKIVEGELALAYNVMPSYFDIITAKNPFQKKKELKPHLFATVAAAY